MAQMPDEEQAQPGPAVQRPRRRPVRKVAPPPADFVDTDRPSGDSLPVGLPPPADEPRAGFTGVGRVLRPHGLRGELRVMVFNPAAPNLQAGRTNSMSGQKHRVQRARHDRDAWIIQLSGVVDRNAAETLRGQLLEAPDNDVLRDDADSFFVHELIGLKVVTDAGRELGTLTEVIFTGANDVYVVKGEGREYLIPAIAQVVSRIDLPVSVMTITPMPGLLDESE